MLPIEARGTVKLSTPAGSPAKAGRRKGVAAALTLALPAILLSACGSDDYIGASPDIPTGCPRVIVPQELSEALWLTSGATSSKDLIARAFFKEFLGNCSYDGSVIEIQMAVDVAAQPGPAISEPFELPVTYFVAITDPSGSVIGKRLFETRIGIEPRGGEVSIGNAIYQSFDVGQAYLGTSYAIVVGMQLSSDQLALNRDLIDRRRQPGQSLDIALPAVSFPPAPPGAIPPSSEPPLVLQE